MVKATERKTNVEIAKSFVKKKSDSKPKKIIKPTENENQISNVQKINSSKQYPDQDSAVERPRTSTIRKDSEPGYIVPEIDEKATGNVVPNNGIFVPNNKDNLDAESDDEKASYEEDFEDYDSDFEDSATDSVPESGNENESLDDEEDSDTLHSDGETNNLTENFVMPKLFGVDTSKGQVRKVEKTFLNMSDRSSLFSNKESIPMADVRPIKVSRSFINFASAVEQEKKKKFSNKVMKRASDLLEIITPDVMSFEVINIPPMKYETYIRTFGKSDTKQAFVQTENFEEEEVQTDEIEMLNKWTQNPPNDNLGYGGDNVRNTMNESENWKSLFADHSVKLSSFLQRSSSVILTLLDEEFPPFSAQSSSLQRSNLFFSDSYNILSPVNFLKDIPVVNVSCCSESDRFIITIHDSMVKLPCSEDFIKEKGIMCVWNLCNRQMPE
ncbi:WD repeat-containing protein 60, partial [Stegodyphus mimosarum]